MLNTFPDLLSFSLIAPFLLRVVAGLFFVRLGIHTARDSRQTSGVRVATLGFLEIAIGALLIVGLFTQISALTGFCLSIILAKVERKDSPRPTGRAAFVLLAMICLSLVLTGAGAFAFDLPL